MSSPTAHDSIADHSTPVWESQRHSAYDSPWFRTPKTEFKRPFDRHLRSPRNYRKPAFTVTERIAKAKYDHKDPVVNVVYKDDVVYFDHADMNNLYNRSMEFLLKDVDPEDEPDQPPSLFEYYYGREHPPETTPNASLSDTDNDSQQECPEQDDGVSTATIGSKHRIFDYDLDLDEGQENEMPRKHQKTPIRYDVGKYKPRRYVHEAASVACLQNEDTTIIERLPLAEMPLDDWPVQVVEGKKPKKQWMTPLSGPPRSNNDKTTRTIRFRKPICAPHSSFRHKSYICI
ncbi:uncharacterized protein BYT42DRAFT_544481 [Radiomyces spectabilis]|uniref:uncharacterized protein n=1 Tax=Radiomyces spectabilis TaxID=64574 RepID=UPI00221E9044|nr:uncharacterized protein BYT42DRAFT_544481 [Radiomyces spectabilis]KAI8384600.1 hypothetical protein BYT42DRAFT_544481 [Radiomyces spectabilis]